MTKYRLKKSQPGFQVADGSLAGRKFERGQSYPETDVKMLSVVDQRRLEKVGPKPAVKPAAAQKGDSK